MTLKRTHAITTFAALALVAAGSLFAAAASAEDTMKPETTMSESMKPDHMKSDGMKADTMKSGHMESDVMKPGHAGDDAMGGPQK
jgi:pentapeptide MXKDX repeat protein